MNSKVFLWLLTIFFALLAACGGSKSDSSGNNDNNSPKNSNHTTKACGVGTNSLKEGESCKINSGKYSGTYTCKSGKIVYPEGETTKGGSWINDDPTKIIVIKCG